MASPDILSSAPTSTARGTERQAKLPVAPEVVELQLKVARQTSGVSGDQEQRKSRDEAAALIGQDTAPAAAPKAPAPDLDFLDQPPAAVAPVPAAVPAAGQDLAFLDASPAPVANQAPVADTERAKKIEEIDRQSISDTEKGKKEGMKAKEEGVNAKDVGKLQENTGNKEELKHANAYAERSKMISDALGALGEERAAQVRNKVADLKKARPELAAGASDDQLMSAYLVANVAALGAGLSTEQKSKFETSVKSLETAGDQKFNELVAKLAPHDAATAKEVYEKAKKDGKMTIVDDAATQLIIADPKDPNAPAERLSVGKKAGQLDRRIGGVRVQPPESADRAQYAKDFSSWIDDLPRVSGIIPTGTLQGILERLAANPNTPLFQKYGQPPYDPARGFDKYNRNIAGRLIEDIFQEPLFVEGSTMGERPVAADGRDLSAHLSLKWHDLQNRLSAGGQAVLFSHLAQDWRKKAAPDASAEVQNAREVARQKGAAPRRSVG